MESQTQWYITDFIVVILIDCIQKYCVVTSFMSWVTKSFVGKDRCHSATSRPRRKTVFILFVNSSILFWLLYLIQQYNRAFCGVVYKRDALLLVRLSVSGMSPVVDSHRWIDSQSDQEAPIACISSLNGLKRCSLEHWVVVMVRRQAVACKWRYHRGNNLWCKCRFLLWYISEQDLWDYSG